MLQNPPSGAGCFVAIPGSGWQSTPCSYAPPVPQLPSSGPAAAQQVGNGNDEVASSSGTIIGTSTGSFPAIVGLTSETGAAVPPFNANCLSGNVPNCFSLQLNTQTFNCNTSFTGGITTNCWEQFVSSNTGQLYIQFWLLNYCSVSGGTNCGDSPPFSSGNPAPSFSCPSTGPPSGTGWMQSGGACYANSAQVSPPTSVATNLGKLSLSGYANYLSSGNDVITLCISGGSCNSVTLSDGVLNLFQNWQQSEFNVFGDASGSQAQFNAGTTINVQTTTTDQSGNPITASCVNNGSTGETNNLFLGSCTGSSGKILFTESSQTFNIAGTPGDVTVLAGTTATYTVGLALTQGPGSPVALSVVSGLPSGATANFSPPSVTPTGSSTLAITTTPSVTLGDFSLTVQGAFGLYIKTTTINLHIYDFSVVTAPSDLTVLRGRTAAYSVTLTLLPGSSTVGIPAIGLAASGLPGDAVSSFTLVVFPALGGATTPLKVQTAGAPSGSLGDFAFTVTGTDPNVSGGTRTSGSANLHIYDFTLSAASIGETVLRGGSGTYAVSLTLTPGSSVPPPISLSASGLPLGSTASFSPPTVAPTLGGATSTLTVMTYTASPGPTALGDFALSVTGHDSVDPSGGSRSDAGASLHTYDFSVTATPSNLLILTTGSNSYSIAVALAPGSTSVGLPTIGLSVSGLPSGAIGSFTVGSGSAAGFTSTLTITTASTPSGIYTLTVAGTDARAPEGGARTASPTLQVLTPQQALQLIINQIAGLRTSGVLNHGQANSLTVKLQHAIDKLNAGQPSTACNMLGAFVNEVNAYEAAGILTVAQANQLLGGPLGVVAIMAAIPC